MRKLSFGPSLRSKLSRDRPLSEPVQRLIVYGSHSKTWTQALGTTAPVWKQLFPSGDISVIQVVHGSIAAELREHAVVLPLMEPHIQFCIEAGYRGLLPSKIALDFFRNKAAFAIFSLMHGLSEFCPRLFRSGEVADFPCVLKRTDLNAAIGVTVAASHAHLRELLNRDPWRNQPYILQELITNADDHVLHAVCRNGRICWHVAYRYEPMIDQFGKNSRCMPAVLSESQLQIFERFLLPVAFSGPCNIDFKILSDGKIQVLELNPRLGGSLMLPSSLGDLTQALRCIFESAVGGLPRSDAVPPVKIPVTPSVQFFSQLKPGSEY